MAPNGRSNIHDDAYMTDTYTVPGPLGDGPEPSSLFVRECGSITFDSQGRIVTICVGLDRPVLALLDPHSLATLAAMPLPLRNLTSGANPFTDFSGGGYFYLDDKDQAVLPTNDRHLLWSGETPAPGFQVVRDYDLSGAVPAGDGIESALPDWSGRFWFVTRQGMVGTVDRSSGAIKTLNLGEGISNSFAVDDTGGVFVVSDKALYRFDAGSGRRAEDSPGGSVYPNSGIHKPGQSDAGSGTTPTLMGKDWVTITDNADPMDVVVYDRSASLDATATAKAKAKGKKKGRRGGEAAAQPGQAAAGLHGARLPPGGELHRPVADRDRQLDRRREQLRLLRHRRDDERRHHRARPDAHGRHQVDDEGQEEEEGSEGQETKERTRSG